MHHMAKFWLTMGHISSCGLKGSCPLSLEGELCHCRSYFSWCCYRLSDSSILWGEGRRDKCLPWLTVLGGHSLSWGVDKGMWGVWSHHIHIQDAERGKGWQDGSFSFWSTHKALLPIFRLTLATSHKYFWKWPQRHTKRYVTLIRIKTFWEFKTFILFEI